MRSAAGKREALTAGKKVVEVMARADPERDLPGQGTRTDLEHPDNIRKLSLSNAGGTSASCLAARIKRDHPDIAAVVERGEHPSMRKAAIAAGRRLTGGGMVPGGRGG